MKYTGNYNLKKPEGTDVVDIEHFNTNADTIDAELAKQMPISGGVLEDYREKIITLEGVDPIINLSLGNVFIHTVSTFTQFTITNAISGNLHSFTLIINRPPYHDLPIIFPPSVKWQGGDIPDLNNETGENCVYALTFLSWNGGTTWLGMFGGEF